jgi:hypothetical protein
VRRLDAALDFFVRARQSKEAIQSGVEPPHSKDWTVECGEFAMSHRRRRPRVMYDNLYWFFIRDLRRQEFSRIEWGPEDLDGHWTTVIDTGCGMFLRRPPLYRECVYRRAPLNSVEFAHTGGDGIHYSFLVLDGYWSELSPVVMTDPCWGSRNVVVGKDLTEFLRLGIRTGYFALPYAVPDEHGRFQDPEHIEVLEAKEFGEWLGPEEVEVLQKLADHFGLEPLDGVAERLADLQHRYQPLIQHPPDRRPGETWEEVEELALARFQPGDAVIWEKDSGGGFLVPVKATVVAVTARRVTIAAEDPDQTGAGVVIRHVNPTRLRLQQRGPASGRASQR